MTGLRRPSGFTLLELLVVIAIILVLAALLTPVVNSALAQARATACLSNLRQVGLFVQGHLHSHDGMFPVLHNRADRSDPRPALDTVWARTDEQEVLRCPSDRRGLHATTGTSYFWNVTLNGQHLDSVFSIVGGSRPSRIPLVSDKEAFHPGVADGVNIVYVDGRVGRDLNFSDSLR